MTQMTLGAGALLKEAGMAKVEHHCQRWVDHARAVAVELAKHGRQVSADTIRASGLVRNPPHPNAWGTVFKGPRWKCVGRTKSLYPQNHLREIRLWELR